MSFEAWTVFALFWVVFVTSPGPNAVNCIQNGMTHGFVRSLWGVLGILAQSLLFLGLSAIGVTALLTTSPVGFLVAKFVGVAFLLGLGIRSWRAAARPLKAGTTHAHSIFGRAFMIATINPKSVAGYLAAFSQFVQPDVPIAAQMVLIVPTAITITAMSYCTYTALGAVLGRAALGAVGNLVVRRGMAVCFILYAVLLAASAVV